MEKFSKVRAALIYQNIKIPTYEGIKTKYPVLNVSLFTQNCSKCIKNSTNSSVKYSHFVFRKLFSYGASFFAPYF